MKGCYLFYLRVNPIVTATACSELSKVLFLALRLVFFVYEISRELLNRLRQIYTEDVFGPLLGRI